MHVTPYLGFDGRCREAFEFYARTLGGTIETMLTHGESPMADQTPPAMRDRIMHASLRAGDVVLMGGDAFPGSGAKPQGMCVSLHLDSPDDADRIFAALSEDGSVQVPLEKTFWAERFAMVTDRFGIPWIING